MLVLQKYCLGDDDEDDGEDDNDDNDDSTMMTS
jgi:hypothetical protein